MITTETIIAVERIRGQCLGRLRNAPADQEAHWLAIVRELDSAPLSLPESGQPPRRGEASTGPEATTESKGWTLRGERRQRAQTEPSGTWEALAAPV